MSRNGKKKNRRGLGIIAITVIVLFVMITMKERSLKEEKEALEIALKETESRLSEEQRRTIELQSKHAYMQTVKYIEDVAREKLGLVYPDEVIFRPEE